MRCWSISASRAKARPQPLSESFRRPGLGQGMSADDRKVAQAWGVAVGLNLPEGKN